MMISVISKQFDFSRLFTTCSDDKLLLKFLVYAPLGGISECLWHLDSHSCRSVSRCTFQGSFWFTELLPGSNFQAEGPPSRITFQEIFSFPQYFTYLTSPPYCCSHQHILKGLRVTFEAFSDVITAYAALARSDHLRKSRKTKRTGGKNWKYFKFKVRRLNKILHTLIKPLLESDKFLFSFQ